MTDDEVRDLLGAYALDAVDDIERRAVERLVVQDEAAARELATLQAVAAELGAATSAEPPASLRATVLAEVARTPQTGRDLPAGAVPVPVPDEGPAVRDDLRERRERRRRLTRFGIAAAVVAALAVPGAVAIQQHERAVQAEIRAEQLSDLLTDPASVVLRGEATGGGEAVAVLGAEGAVLLAEGLPALDGDLVYQLWAMRDGVPVPAGLLDVRDGTVQALAEEGYLPGDGLAVSVEPAGGSPQPTTDPVLVLIPG
ncbi:anti-sigma factor domain-containing protein [Actinotalea sp. K2]|uniref:anti-sigma factor n=1 Tax=Actinotalea sp. K2 TaxID=2939438 RepID=UPI00201827AC|nr:anti-sigma factor [Actinotalea sp. K2]MCL3861352.1 anti-sigma factor [Actinotalea sp. K2]